MCKALCRVPGEVPGVIRLASCPQRVRDLRGETDPQIKQAAVSAGVEAQGKGPVPRAGHQDPGGPLGSCIQRLLNSFKICFIVVKNT